MRFVRLRKTENITLGIIDEQFKRIEMRPFKLTYSLYTTPSDEDESMGAKDQNAAYQKINYMLTDVIDGSFLYTFESAAFANQIMTSYDNNCIALPNVSEITLLESLHSKFNTIAGEYSHVESLELHDVNTEQTFVYLQETVDDDIIYDLPSAKGFLGEYLIWDAAWWQRYDVTTSDYYINSEEELEKFKELVDMNDLANVTRTVLDDIDAAINEFFVDENSEPGEVIDLESMKEHIKGKEQWKPTLV
jgi:hypothetical protein